MKNISDWIKNWICAVEDRKKVAFLTTFVLGLLLHLPVMLSDIPNHDGLLYLYDAQNVVTSGRFFLTVACGISSYFALPWVTGLLGIFYLALAAVMLVEVLELQDGLSAALCGGLLVSFPALASTFAYAFALDGYMMALALSVASVYFTKKYKWGWCTGLVCLALSMGIYQSYLPFAILLSLYQILLICLGEGTKKEKWKKVLPYAYMGVAGGSLYFVLLKVLLAVEGKTLDTYQGIDTIGGGMQLSQLPAGILRVWKDGISFTLTSHVVMPNGFAAVCMGILVLCAFGMLVRLVLVRKLYRSVWLYLIALLLLLAVPTACGVIYLISPGLNFHLLMRYQWVILPICMLAFFQRFFKGEGKQWVAPVVALSAAGLVFVYGLVDNIGYSNLEKKYEKTYAYCVRLLNRMESTEGYYQGIPVAIMGVVGDDNFPVTDFSDSVTGSLTGLSGDYLLYKATDYKRFMSTYLGATITLVSEEKEAEIYYSPEYIEMESFPGKTSVQIIDGILCVKTEDALRD